MALFAVPPPAPEPADPRLIEFVEEFAAECREGKFEAVGIAVVHRDGSTSDRRWLSPDTFSSRLLGALLLFTHRFAQTTVDENPEEPE